MFKIRTDYRMQAAKLGPVSRAAGMDCEYPIDHYRRGSQKGQGSIYDQTTFRICREQAGQLPAGDGAAAAAPDRDRGILFR